MPKVETMPKVKSAPPVRNPEGRMPVRLGAVRRARVDAWMRRRAIQMPVGSAVLLLLDAALDDAERVDAIGRASPGGRGP